MTDKQIEESIRKAANDIAPDMLGDLMEELGLEMKQTQKVDGLPQKETPQPERLQPAVRSASARKGRRWYKALASCAAVLIVFAGSFAFFGGQGKVNAVVGLDVNPSIELSVDKKGRVVKAEAINEDGQKILDDMDLKKDDVSDACNTIVDELVAKGYLTLKSNSVLVSVQAEDPEAGRGLEESLSGSINSHLQGDDLKPAVVGQYIEEDEALSAFAGDNNISVGKANLIKSIVAAGKAKATEESLLKLSTQELVLIGQSREAAGDVSYGQADTSDYISKEQAKTTALTAAGVAEADAREMEIEFDCEDGIIVYEVEFKSAGREYEYEVDASTGKIFTEESEADDDDDEDRDDDDDGEDLEDSDDDDDDD